MEGLLSMWIEDQMKKGSGTNFLTINKKALSIYEDVTKKAENSADLPAFNASSGWFAGFKNRHALHNVKLCGEAVSADEEHVTAFPPMGTQKRLDDGAIFSEMFLEKLQRIKEHCVDLATQVGFGEVESEDVEELLETHSEDLSTADLPQLVTEGEVKAGDEEDEVRDAAPQELSTFVLSSVL
eukprot:g29258.t1